MFLLLPLLAAAGCGRSATDRELDRVDAVMETDPELADAMLDSISPGRGADRARHALYRLVATGKLTGTVDNDSLLTLVADRYCTPDAPPSRDAMIANFYRGAAYGQSDSIRKSVNSLLRASVIAEELRDSLYLCRIYGALAMQYRNDFQNDMFVDYSRKAVVMARVADQDNLVHDLSRLAEAYHDDYQYSNAWKYYEEALRTDAARNNGQLRCNILSEYGISKAYAGDIADALRIFSEADTIGDMDANALGAYAWMLDASGDSQKAETYLHRSSMSSREEDSELQKRYYYYSYLINRNNRKYDKAFEAMDSFENIAEDHLLMRLEQPASYGHISYLRDDTEFLRKEAELREHIEILWTVIATIILTIIVATALYLLRKRHKRIYALTVQTDDLKSELSNVYDEIEQKEIDYDHLRDETSLGLDITINLLKENLAAMREIIDITTIEGNNKTGPILKKMRENVNRLFDIRKGGVLYRYIDSTKDNIISCIKSDLPDFSETAIRIFAFSLMGISYHSIALLLGLEYDNVVQYRSRLKKALLSSGSSNIELYKKYLLK